MKLLNREDSRVYDVTTEEGDFKNFRIYARGLDGGGNFTMGYESLSDFLDDWGDAD